MSHVADDVILSARDLPAVETTPEQREHLRSCLTCRTRLREAEERADVVRSALGALDHAWDIDTAKAAVRARLGPLAVPRATTASGRTDAGRRARFASISLGRAAAAALVLATGVAALPGSPVRAWLTGGSTPAPMEVVEDARTVEDAAGAALEAAPEAAPAGVRIDAPAGALRIEVTGLTPGQLVEFRWTRAGTVSVTAPSGSRFTSAEGRVEATVVAGPVRIEAPLRPASTTLVVGGRVYLRASGDSLETPGPVQERTAEVVVFRTPG